MNPEQCMYNIYEKCCSKLSAFEIWKGYYSIRFEEFKRNYQLFPEKYFSNILEIGCGIGYQSAFLSCISKSVVASDIDLGNMIKHSRGLDITKQFIKESEISNISVVNANAENLPFADNSFDFVYCSYAFQYIPDKPRALKEIKRVLKSGGYFFCVLPATGNRIKAAKDYYKTVIKKIPSYLFSGKLQSEKSTKLKQARQNMIAGLKRTKLLPPSDDESNNFFTELFNYSPASWRKLFLKNGHIIILEKNSNYSSNLKMKGSFIRRLKEQFSSNGFIIITKK